MKRNEIETRDKIIEIAKQILTETDDVERITVRQIAQRAEVGIGLINYHFKSKDNLLSLAVGELMAGMVLEKINQNKDANQNPDQKLKSMLKDLYGFGEKHEKLVKFLITRGLLDGDAETPLFLVPALREIFGNEKDEFQLRIIAFQILVPIQVASLNPTTFHMFSGIDLNDAKRRDEFIDLMVDNLVVR